MSLDYSLIGSAAPEEFTGHYVRDFLGKKINLSYDNILSLTKKYCKILRNIFEPNDKRIILSPLSPTEDTQIYHGVININNTPITIFLNDASFQIDTINVLLKASPDIGEFCVYTSLSYMTFPLYEYFCSKNAGIKITNYIFDISSKDINFAESLETLRALYEP